MSISRETAGGRAFIELQRRAKNTNRNNQELIQLYILEGFLARLAQSPVREKFVLKGGVLLAAFGNRRPTRDIDFAVRAIGNDEATVLTLIKSVLAVPLSDDDGIEFAPDTATSEVIRDDAHYSGVRVSSNANMATSRNRFHVDVNVGDPIVPKPAIVSVPRLIGGDTIRLKGYPVHMVHAEKIVTAVQRGVAKTRWRDFGDIWTLSRSRAVAGPDLQRAIREVARHRRAELSALSDALDGYADLAQARWEAWRRRQNREELPAQLGDLLTEVIAFAEPAITGDLKDMRWNPNDRQWV